MLEQKIQEILNEIKKYTQDVTLVVVTKNRNLDEIKKVINAGAIDISENKVQEALKKAPLIKGVRGIKFHLIGHLQSNKVKKAVEIFDMIQSVDSFELLEKINKESATIHKIMSILLQINIFEDPKKFGFHSNEINSKKIIELSKNYKNIKINGLMTIAMDNLSAKKTYEGFEKLANLYNNLNKELKTKNFQLTTISMGMSNDYKIALKAGSNMIRIGNAIFEDKNTPT